MGHPFKSHLSPQLSVSLSSSSSRQRWSLAPAGGAKSSRRLSTAPDRDSPGSVSRPAWAARHTDRGTGPSAHCTCGSLQTQETELACLRGHQHLYCRFNLNWKNILLTVTELGDTHKLGGKSQGTALEPLKYHADSCAGKNPKESDTWKFIIYGHKYLMQFDLQKTTSS